MTDASRDPRDELDEPATAPRRPQQQQEVIGPTDALQKSALDVGLLRMELDASMEHALRHRRSIDVVVRQIEQMALYNDAAANRCVYSLPRADKAIIGPSIGLATIIATAWGNCNDGGWWIRTDRAEKVVVCGGTFFDLESNRRTGGTVTRRISGKSGRIYTDDMIAVTIQAATAIAQRNAILKGVPAPIWRPVYERALVVVRGTTETLPERRTKMIAAFAAFGVTPARIFQALGAKTETEITLDHMVMLRGMYEQLKDELMTAEEMFDPRRMTGAVVDQVHNPMADDDDTPPGGETTTQRGNGAAPARSAPAVTTAPKQQPEAPTAAQPATEGAKSPEAATQAPPAENNAPAATGEAKDEGGTRKKPGPKPKAAKEPAAATQAPAAQEPDDDEALTTAGYVRNATAFINSATTPSELDNWWKGERNNRTKYAVVEDDFANLRAAYMQRLAALKEPAQ